MKHGVKVLKHFEDNINLELVGDNIRLSDGWNTDYIFFYGFNDSGKNMGFASDGYFHISDEIKKYLEGINIGKNLNDLTKDKL